MQNDPWGAFPDAQQDPWGAFPDAGAAPAEPSLPPGVVRANAARAEYDAMPWYKQAAQAADDVVRLMADGLTFGYADKLAGAMGDGVEAERAKTQAASDRAGSAGTAAEIVGGVIGPAKLNLAGRAVAAAPKVLGGLAARTGLRAVEGAGYGALSATGHDTDVKTGAGIGALAGGAGSLASEVLTGVGNKLAGLFNKAPKAPTEDEVRNLAQQAYAAADNAGIVFTPQMVDGLKQRITQSLTGMGYDPALQPGAATVVRRLEELTGKNVTLTDLDTLRKVAGNGYVQGNKSNNKAVGEIVAAIDDAVGSAANTPGHVLTGNAQAGADALRQARDMWSRLSKAERVDTAKERALLRAESTGAGGNQDNAIRQNMRRIYEQGRGFSPDEEEALLRVIKGSPGQDLLRTMGRFAYTSPLTGGVGGMVGASVGSGFGPAGAAIGAAALPAVGTLAKKASDRMTANHVDRLVELILAGGNKAALQAQPNAAQRAITGSRDDISRLIMSAQREQMQ